MKFLGIKKVEEKKVEVPKVVEVVKPIEVKVVVPEVPEKFFAEAHFKTPDGKICVEKNIGSKKISELISKGFRLNHSVDEKGIIAYG